jgi:hypothetical protein
MTRPTILLLLRVFVALGMCLQPSPIKDKEDTPADTERILFWLHCSGFQELRVMHRHVDPQTQR